MTKENRAVTVMRAHGGSEPLTFPGLFNETGSQVSTGRSTASKKTVVNFGPLFLSLVNSHPHLHAEHIFGTQFFFFNRMKTYFTHRGIQALLTAL